MRLDEIKIGELAGRTSVSTRLLRYYEAQGLLHADRDANGYRVYGESAVERVLLIRELLESGFTTELIHFVLPCMKKSTDDGPGAGEPLPCAVPANIEKLRRQEANIARRLETLSRTHDAIRGYLTATEAALKSTATATTAGTPI